MVEYTVIIKGLSTTYYILNRTLNLQADGGFLSNNSGLHSDFDFPIAKEQWRTLLEKETSQAN